MDERDDRSAASRGHEVMASLEGDGVKAVALGFVDPSAIIRVKVIPVGRFAEAAAGGVGLSTLFNAATSADTFALLPGFIDGPSGDLRLRPDPEATVPLASMPGWAWAPVDQFTQEGERFAACPRGFLQRMVARLGAEGLSVLAAYEFEFFLGIDGEDGGFIPAHRGPGYSDIALGQNHEFALDLIDTLERQGVGLQQFHPEYADGQFELSVSPRDPVATADLASLLRQLVRSVARRHGWRASFAPRVLGETGNGVHLHLSVWDGDENLLAGGTRAAGMQARGESFLAGILEELPAIVAVTAPTVESYLRLQPHRWSGAMQCWGTENREAALRFVAGVGGHPAAANGEVKPIDATANPYLALGTILAAGLHGLTAGTRLPPSTEEDPFGLPSSEREARGVRQLPASLPEAIERFAASDVLHEAMGDYLFQTFLATRREENEIYTGMDDEELIRRLRWRY